MKKTEIRIVCDLCAEPPLTAEIRCAKHRLDLCICHVRVHFDRGKCRLVPVAREDTASDEISQKIRETLGGLRRLPASCRRNGKKRRKG
jgi:hypothetical protein